MKSTGKSALKFALAATAACLMHLPALAQDQAETEPMQDEQMLAEEGVLAAVETFMAGLGDKDAEAMTSVALDTAFLAFARPDEDGDALRTMPLSRAITSLAETVPDISEPIRDPVVMTDGTTAMVWAPYDFYVNNARNHCGVNVFSLLNRDGDWMIASVVYSYLPEGCPEEAEPMAEAEEGEDVAEEASEEVAGEATDNEAGEAGR